MIGIVLGAVRLVALRLGGPMLQRPVGARLVTLVETTCLSGATSLHVVRIGERCYLLGRTPSSLRTLAEFPAEEIACAPGTALSRPSPLATLLRAAERLRRAP